VNFGDERDTLHVSTFERKEMRSCYCCRHGLCHTHNQSNYWENTLWV